MLTERDLELKSVQYRKARRWRGKGAGEIGGTLTRRLTALGHHVLVANSRGPESLAELAGAKPCAKLVSVAEAARSGEVVIVTIPEKNISNLPHDLFAATPDSVVIVDTGNYYRVTVVSMQSKPVRPKADGLRNN